jgi:SAM-dependent methyltransferase
VIHSYQDAPPIPAGQCTICGHSGAFLNPEQTREGTQCRNCGASSRHRAVVHTLGMLLGRTGTPLFQWKPDRAIRILESSARGSYPAMMKELFEYYATEYDETKIAEGKQPTEYADFQKLHFADKHFDVVIASDVFEHVRKDDQGYREIFRVLKPGGSLLLTVPYDHERPQTLKRVDTSGPTDVHLLEPEYHGGGGLTLTYRNYGRDLLDLLTSVGYSVCHLDLEVRQEGITRQPVFVATKGPAAGLAVRAQYPAPTSSLGPVLPLRLFTLLKYNWKTGLGLLKQARKG